MTFEESTRRISEIGSAQCELLDYTGHVYRGMSKPEADALVERINTLRASVGWRPLDMTDRWHRR